MGGRNNKLCDKKGQDPTGVRQAKKPTKRNPSFIPLSESKLVMKRLSFDDEGVLVKLYDLLLLLASPYSGSPQ